jgi:hypothetical protein
MRPDYVGLELALDHWRWADASDQECAERFGTSVSHVRDRRRVRRENLLLPEIRQLALDVQQLNGWDEPVVDTIRTVLRFAKIAGLAARATKSAALAIRTRLALRRVS